MKAASRAEPLPPQVSQGAVLSGLYDALGEEQAKAFWRWLSVDLPEWGRTGWERLDAARAADCR